ncbi:MAG: hypothetical protein U1F10_02390 [Burkholderiales bacterium]
MTWSTSRCADSVAEPVPGAARLCVGLVVALAAVAATAAGVVGLSRPVPTVLSEQVIYAFTPPDNGAGPLWDIGSTNLVRFGDRIVASGIATISGERPYNNVHCTLWERAGGTWHRLHDTLSGRTREPCPVAQDASTGRLFVSTNPTMLPEHEAGGGPARPEVLQWQAGVLALPPEVLLPQWGAPAPQFSEHSYRSLAADPRRGDLILFQNVDYTHAEWAFRTADGQWRAQGRLMWPWGATYESPKPVRICYPNVVLADRGVHFVGVSDVVEPNSEWRAWKRALTGKEWDYDFRRLFYTHAPDIARGTFGPWLEIANRERTAGRILPGDLRIDAAGAAHIVWQEQAIDVRLRERFFPAERQRWEINYAVVHHGKVLRLRTLASADEDRPGPIPHLPRFHVSKSGRVFVVYYANGVAEDGSTISENRILEVREDGSSGPSVRLDLMHPLSTFMTATPRAGTPASDTLDLMGTAPDSPNTMRYAQIRLP